MTTGCSSAKPHWYRGNLHTHSLWSDGNDVPEMICDWYKENGYQFVALSDHNILSTNPVWQGQRKKAWTQPVGWRKRSK